MDLEREFALGDREFGRICHLVNERTGIKPTESKRDLVYGRLVRRIKALRLGGFTDYCDLLSSNSGEEFEHFANAITTNLTSFFREGHHFEHLGGQVIPALRENNADTRRIRVWSAGCSTGEEVYSIAITFFEAMPDIETWDVKILATDLDSNVLAAGEEGVYDETRIQGLDAALSQRWFRCGSGANTGQVKVSPRLRSLVTFKQLNLMEAWPMHGPFDVVFCRNVVIYFDKDTQRVLFDRVADLMAEQSSLFIGHSESLFKVTDRFEPIGRTIYRKRY